MKHTAKRIATFCRQHGYAVGSGYHNGLFIVSERDPVTRGRIWRVVHATHTKRGLVFDVLDRANPTQVGAKVVMERAMAERGISIHTKPNLDLSGIPHFPHNLNYGRI